MENVRAQWDSMDSYCKHNFLQCPYKTKTVQTKEGQDKDVKYVDDCDLSMRCGFSSPYNFYKPHHKVTHWWCMKQQVVQIDWTSLNLQ